MISTQRKNNWRVKESDAELEKNLVSEFNLHPVLSKLLIHRGVKTGEEILQYLNPSIASTYNPFKLSGMDEAVGRIHRAVSNKEKIALYSDSDMDGLTSLSIMIFLFRKFGIEPIYQFPTGDTSYEISTSAIDEFSQAGVDLIITLDIGINEVETIKYAREKGIDVIVCDHHEQNDQLPEAIIVNPKQKNCDYPFSNLAGVGVAFKLSTAVLLKYLKGSDKDSYLITTVKGKLNIISTNYGGDFSEPQVLDSIGELKEKINSEGHIIFFDLNNGQIAELNRLNLSGISVYNMHSLVHSLPSMGVQDCLEYLKSVSCYKVDKHKIVKELFSRVKFYSSIKIFDFIEKVLPFVSLGTIADVMPLVDENRVLLYHGLKKFNKSTIPSLIRLRDIADGEVSSHTIGWKFSPLLNSPGRIGKSELTISFLIGSDDENIDSIFQELNSINEDRKKLLNDITEELIGNMESNPHLLEKNLIFASSTIIPAGFSGLVANRMADHFGKPAIVISDNDDSEFVKGSGRGSYEYDFFSHVISLGDSFERIGGHAQAFGFTLKKSEVNDIISQIDSSLTGVGEDHNSSLADMEIEVFHINDMLYKNIKKLEPFGSFNEEPIFLSRDVNIKSVELFGKEKNHLKLLLNDAPYEAIMWRGAGFIDEIKCEGTKIDLAYRLEEVTYFNRKRLRLNIIDLIIK